MKLLVDAQLPIKLCDILNALGIESMRVDLLPKGDETPDIEIIEYADQANLMVVTKDIDFYHYHMTEILITTGNLKNRELFNLFRNNSLMIKRAIIRSSFIEINHSGITEHG